MKFFYILNNNKKMIDFGRVSGKRGKAFESLINVKINDDNFMPLFSNLIYLNTATIEKEIEKLLDERNLKPLDIPEYKGRFKEKEIFENKKFKNHRLKLCNTGFDNKIIFFINLYDSACKDEKPYYIFLANNHNQFRNARK